MQKSASAYIGSSPAAADHGNAMPGQRAGERELRKPFRQRHHRGQRHRRRTTDENVDPQLLAVRNAAW